MTMMTLLLPIKKIVNSLDKYGYDIDAHISEHLLNSAKNEKGIYSLKKLKEKFLDPS